MIVYVAYERKRLDYKAGYDTWSDIYTLFGGVFDNELDAAKFCMTHRDYRYMEYDTATQECHEIEV